MASWLITASWLTHNMQTNMQTNMQDHFFPVSPSPSPVSKSQDWEYDELPPNPQTNMETLKSSLSSLESKGFAVVKVFELNKNQKFRKQIKKELSTDPYFVSPELCWKTGFVYNGGVCATPHAFYTDGIRKMNLTMHNHIIDFCPKGMNVEYLPGGIDVRHEGHKQESDSWRWTNHSDYKCCYNMNRTFIRIEIVPFDKVHQNSDIDGNRCRRNKVDVDIAPGHMIIYSNTIQHIKAQKNGCEDIRIYGSVRFTNDTKCSDKYLLSQMIKHQVPRLNGEIPKMFSSNQCFQTPDLIEVFAKNVHGAHHTTYTTKTGKHVVKKGTSKIFNVPIQTNTFTPDPTLYRATSDTEQRMITPHKPEKLPVKPVVKVVKRKRKKNISVKKNISIKKQRLSQDDLQLEIAKRFAKRVECGKGISGRNKAEEHSGGWCTTSNNDNVYSYLTPCQGEFTEDQHKDIENHKACCFIYGSPCSGKCNCTEQFHPLGPDTFDAEEKAGLIEPTCIIRYLTNSNTSKKIYTADQMNEEWHKGVSEARELFDGGVTVAVGNKTFRLQ